VALAAAERGQLTEARRDLDTMTRSDSKSLGVLEPLYWWVHGVLARAEGRPAAAATALHRTVDCYAAMNAWALRGFALADLAEISVSAGDCDAAMRAAASAEETARRTGVPLHHALHLLAASWALIGHGQRDQAARVALRAVDGFACRGYALLAARAQIAYATAVGRSDRSAARNAVQAAIGTYDTAAQIAVRLHIGVRTVETHLTHSYAKLGVTSKQQLVLRRAELGLAPGP
jgi:ATP/maltotriose-dependent transcriptional regulator MalT